MKKTVYYAHFMGIYNTKQEERDIEALKKMGLKVFNPNVDFIQDEVQAWKAKEDFDYTEMFEDIFIRRVKGADMFAFRALPDGRIPAGVAWELREAIKAEKSIIELPACITARSMSVDETREYLMEIGER